MEPVQIIEADYRNDAHRAAIPFLLNEYARDLLGFRKELDKTVLANLVPGLEKFPNARVVLARCHSHYVGMVICLFGFSTFKARPSINIHDFLVVREYRNQGIGKKLLQAVELIAKQAGCCKITLEVQEKNVSARKLYHAYGFKNSFPDPEAGDQMFLTKEL